MNRRTFLNTSATAAATLAAARSTVRAEVGTKPMRVGLIGSGWYGMVNLRNLLAVTQGNSKVEIAALCDPDANRLKVVAEEVAKRTKREQPATFADFREMLKPKNLDVVIVGSPDHWHALHAIDAMNAGADVYCEKPICHTINEGKAMVRVAEATKRIVQIGTQRRSTPHIARAKEFIRSGAAGTIGTVKACCYYNMRATDNPPDTDPPAGFDFDLWQGPAPARRYNPLFHPKRWRAFTEYSNGIVGDMFVHMLDCARWILDLGQPKTVSSIGGILVQKKAKANITDTQSIALDYGHLNVLWEHRTYGQPDDPRYPWAVMFFGEKGVVKVDVDKWEFVPHGGAKAKAVQDSADLNKELADSDQPANIVPAGLAHMKNFLECVATRTPPIADIREGYISTTTCLLGNIAQDLSRTLKWDAKTQLVTSDTEANARFAREYRAPWVYPTA